VAHRGGCRWSGCSGEGRARSGLQVAGDAMVGTGDVGERRWVLAVGRELELTAAARGGGV
jgi:hypothetical protein